MTGPEIAEYFTAASTVALVVVGYSAAEWAKKAATGALRTLRLEYDPVLVLGWSGKALPTDQMRQIEKVKDSLLVLPSTTAGGAGCVFLTIRNVGRGAALNIRGKLTIKDFRPPDEHESAVYIEGLAPGDVFVISLLNKGPSVYSVDFGEFTFESASDLTARRAFRSSALPASIG